jgi:large subunit ribosomal protein L22
MNTATAQLNNYRQSPRKVRLVADLVRGKKVEQAISALQFADKKAALPIEKLLRSALSNAKNLNLDSENLVVKSVTVNSGKILYRSLPMARGRAFRMRKRTSKVVVVLGEKTVKVKVAKKAKAVKK